MSIASEITRINNNIANAYTSVNNKGGTLPATQNSANLATAITSIPSGGGGASEEKDVNFYDYDGTLVDSYTKQEFLALSNLPNNPTHTGLTPQGWNWILTDAQSYVTDYGKLDIGQMYTTSSGLSEFDIELTTVTGLTATLKMDGTKNWGDGTTDTNTTHTYNNAGKYTITCNGTQITSTMSSGLFGQSASLKNYYVKEVRLSNITNLVTNTFQYCYSLNTVILPNSVTKLGNNNTFQNCHSLEYVTIPNSVTTVGTGMFDNCYSFKKITIPRSMTSLGTSNLFYNCYSLTNISIPNSITNINQRYFYYCYSLTKMVIPKSVTKINSYAFSTCVSITLYDFRKFSSVPTLSNANAFTEINNICKIVVPDNLYSTWIGTTNWSNFANYIIKESEWNA